MSNTKTTIDVLMGGIVGFLFGLIVTIIVYNATLYLEVGRAVTTGHKQIQAQLCASAVKSQTTETLTAGQQLDLVNAALDTMGETWPKLKNNAGYRANVHARCNKNLNPTKN